MNKKMILTIVALALTSVSMMNAVDCTYSECIKPRSSICCRKEEKTVFGTTFTIDVCEPCTDSFCDPACVAERVAREAAERAAREAAKKMVEVFGTENPKAEEKIEKCCKDKTECDYKFYNDYSGKCFNTQKPDTKSQKCNPSYCS